MTEKMQVPCPVVEVARSFSYKLNAGNYESRDFFCSQKAECMSQDAERVSEALYEFCKKQVLQSVCEYKAEHDKIEAALKTPAATLKRRLAEEAAKLDKMHEEKKELSNQ